jgi:hypothetical protein
LAATFKICSLVVRANNDIDLVTNGSLVNRTAGSASNADAALTVGGRAASGQWHDGDIAEVLIFSRALTTAERSQMERYLSAKYALGSVG